MRASRAYFLTGMTFDIDHETNQQPHQRRILYVRDFCVGTQPELRFLRPQWPRCPFAYDQAAIEWSFSRAFSAYEWGKVTKANFLSFFLNHWDIDSYGMRAAPFILLKITRTPK